MNAEAIEEIITRQMIDRFIKLAAEYGIELSPDDFQIHADGTVTLDGATPEDWLADMTGVEE